MEWRVLATLATPRALIAGQQSTRPGRSDQPPRTSAPDRSCQRDAPRADGQQSALSWPLEVIVAFPDSSRPFIPHPNGVDDSLQT